jgi:tetraacyldisaccharide 4'-kinase
MTGVRFRDAWERKGLIGKLLWFLLVPASSVYLLLVYIRNALYSLGWMPVHTLPRPVISIGNLTVGGTGKTPSCLWLAGELEKRGFKVAILSRGYRRRQSKPLILDARGDLAGTRRVSLDISAAGDEPFMMARVYGQLIGIGKNRYQTAQNLLSQRNVDVFLLDDGYQHRQLKRDVDLLLLGIDCRGSVLPAGPFRESIKSLRRADYFLITGAAEAWRSLIPRDGDERCFAGSLRSVALVGFESDHWKKYPLSLLYRSKILTVTGIADTTGFYRMIHEWEGEIVETLEFPDHHSYSARDWQQINRLSRRIDLIITTEKDMVKFICFPFPKDKLLALRVAMAVENGDALVNALAQKITVTTERTTPLK